MDGCNHLNCLFLIYLFCTALEQFFIIMITCIMTNVFFLNVADVPKHAKTQKADRVSAECNKVNYAEPDIMRLTVQIFIMVILSISQTS